MSILNIKILKSNARRVLEVLAERKLISIKEKSPNEFLNVLKAFRSRKTKISIVEITKEVEIARTRNQRKKSHINT